MSIVIVHSIHQRCRSSLFTRFIKTSIISVHSIPQRRWSSLFTRYRRCRSSFTRSIKDVDRFIKDVDLTTHSIHQRCPIHSIHQMSIVTIHSIIKDVDCTILHSSKMSLYPLNTPIFNRHYWLDSSRMSVGIVHSINQSRQSSLFTRLIKDVDRHYPLCQNVDRH